MNSAPFVVLAQNAALLLSLVFLFNLLLEHWPTNRGWLHDAVAGTLIGAISCVLMQTPWQFSPGIFFDVRSVLISVTGLFFGTIPTLIAMAISAAFRLTQGGTALTGVSVILASGLLGIAWRRLHPKPPEQMKLRSLYGFGLLVHGVMLLLMLTLPWDSALKVLAAISVPVMVIYPLASLLLCNLLALQIKNQELRQAAQDHEQRLSLSLAAAKQGLYDLNVQTGEALVSPEYAEMLGYDPAQFHETNAAWVERLHPDDREAVAQTYREYVAGRLPEYRVEFRQRKASGDWIWILSVGRLVERDAKGKPLRMLGTHTEITSLKNAEKQAQTAAAEVRQLLEQSDRARLALLSIVEDSNESRQRLEETNRRLLAEIEGRSNAEEKLVNSEAQFRQLIEKSTAGMYVLRDDSFIYVNPRMEKLMGQSFPELAGRSMASLMDEKDVPHFREVRGRLTTLGDSAMFTIPISRPDVGNIEMGVSEIVIEFEGKPAILGMAQDVTERKRAQAEINRYLRQLEEANEKTLQAISAMVEQRDPYTAGHERRVGDLAADIAVEMGLPESQAKGIRLAGYVHDIGKIAVPSEILSKPSRLSDIEMSLIREHSQVGHNILKSIEFPWPIANIILQHHERLDGSGYPQHLKGDAILLEARIIAVADTLEAMNSHRPYRAGLGIEIALAEIKKGAGTLYDQKVVDACLRMFVEKKYVMPD